MKARKSLNRVPQFVLMLTMALVSGGLAQDNLGPSPASVRDAKTVIATPTRPGPGFSATNTLREPSSPTMNTAPEAAISKGTHLSPWATEVVKLAQAGVEDGVVLSFIDDTEGTFNLGADQLIYLNRLGIGNNLITAMLQHDSEVASGARTLTASTVPASQPALQLAFVTVRSAPEKAGQQPAAVSPSGAPINDGLADVPDAEVWPEANHDFNSSTISDENSATAFEPGVFTPPESSQERQTPAENGNLYPVREPYPVQLTDPIVMIRAWGRTPNTILLDPFPD